jgi:lipopolysaccharide heptosyltransferase II
MCDSATKTISACRNLKDSLNQVKKILIRLPNWLGDMVMSTAFVKAVQVQYPDATIDLVAKKGIDFLLDYFPEHGQSYIFNKDEYKGLRGVYQFGKQISKQNHYDIFFCLPDSFSSAVMTYAVQAKKRVGFKKELRSFLLTDSFVKQKNLHRVEEYINLLQQFYNSSIPVPPVELQLQHAEKKNAVIVNINSEASSRRLPVAKAVSIINALQSRIGEEIILVGSPKEKAFVDEVYALLNNTGNISNYAGKTNLQELIQLLGSCPVMLTTDSGPAHVANALGTHTVVLFGAGNENNTAPYNKENCTVLRSGQPDCAPCVNNTCKLYGSPKCLELLDESIIVQQVIHAMKNKFN